MLGANIQRQVRTRYDDLHERLLDWESAVQEYHSVLKARVDIYSKELRREARRRVAVARSTFRESRLDWNSLVRQCSAA